MGFESAPRRMIPYSVSIPQTFRIAIAGPYPFAEERPLHFKRRWPPTPPQAASPAGGRVGRRGRAGSAGRPSTIKLVEEPPVPRRNLEILACAHTLDGPSAGSFLALRHERADVHDPLALLARDLGPVVGVGGVGQVLVLLVLLLDGFEQVGGTDPPALAGDDPL